MNYTTDFKSIRAEVSAEEGGFVGLRWTGRLPQSFGRVVAPSN